MSAKKKDGHADPPIDTGGGAHIEGGVNTGGGDFVGRDKVIYAHSDLEELNDYLARAVAAYEARMERALRKQPPPAHPYKYLYAYDLEDAPHLFRPRRRRTSAVPQGNKQPASPSCTPGAAPAKRPCSTPAFRRASFAEGICRSTLAALTTRPWLSSGRLLPLPWAQWPKLLPQLSWTSSWAVPALISAVRRTD